MTIGYVHGITTFTASTEMLPYRLVRMKSGSITVPVEVEYTDTGIVVGLTLEPAKAGERLSIMPLNVEGTYQAEVLINSAIVTGSPLFVASDGSGRATDENTGYYTGQAVTGAAITGEVIEIVGVVGAVGTGDAADIGITDTGGYYSSGDVEGALQEIGAAFDHPIEIQFPAPYLLRTDSSFNPMNEANIGGILASDTADVALLKDSDDVFRAVISVASGASAYMSCTFGIPTLFDPAANMKFGFYYKTAAANLNYTVTFHCIVVPSSGTPVLHTFGASIDQATSLSYRAVHLNLPVSSDTIMIAVNMEFKNDLGDLVNPLEIYSITNIYQGRVV